MLTSAHHYARPCATCLLVGKSGCLQLLTLQEQRLQQQGRDSWSGRVEIRLADIKLVITGEAPAPGGRSVIILGFVVNILSLSVSSTGQARDRAATTIQLQLGARQGKYQEKW